ncbi:hypothetical protein ACHAW6_011969 [Cyclotella cf. meneghiniana]
MLAPCWQGLASMGEMPANKRSHLPLHMQRIRQQALFDSHPWCF